jgi:hypothetical protein
VRRLKGCACRETHVLLPLLLLLLLLLWRSQAREIQKALLSR